jgi:anti-sigma factor ChrR (cupin superfamily)
VGKDERESRQEVKDEVAITESGLAWEPAGGYHDGTQWKVLRCDPDGEPKAALLKLPPAFEMDAHAHVHAENHYVLDGQYESQGSPISGAAWWR